MENTAKEKHQITSEVIKKNILGSLEEILEEILEEATELARTHWASRQKKSYALNSLQRILFLDNKDYCFKLTDDESYVVITDKSGDVIQVIDVTGINATQMVKQIMLQNRDLF